MDRIEQYLTKDISFKSLGPSPVSLTKYTFISTILPNIQNYAITDKADGQRAYAILNDKKATIFTATSDKPKIDDTINGPATVVLDGELINNVLYVFDIVSDKPFEERYKNLLKLHLPNNIKIKPYKYLTTATYQKDIMLTFNKKRAYTIDGLIFTELGQSYSNTKHYKWKPPSSLTIDFLVANDKLYVGINNKVSKTFNIKTDILGPPINCPHKDSNYRPTLFKPSILPENTKYSDLYTPPKKAKNGQIIECILEASTNKPSKWVLVKTRDDKMNDLKSCVSYGNDYRTAELTLQSILNPLTLEELINTQNNLLKEVYFQKTDDAYINIRRFNNYAKSRLINRARGSNIVLDLGIGKGQDLMKYMTNNIHTLIAIERDRNAIDELLDRKYSLTKINNAHMEIVIETLDIKTTPWDTIKNSILNHFDTLPSTGHRTVVSNFAIHYFADTLDAMENLAGLLDWFMRPGDEFIATTFIKDYVNTALKPYGKWERSNGLYYIERVKENKNRIRVKLPCSMELREETLLDINMLDRVLAKKNIIRLDTKSLGYYLPNYKEHLTDDEKDFVRLYGYIIYNKCI